jgi:hypothetical protein
VSFECNSDFEFLLNSSSPGTDSFDFVAGGSEASSFYHVAPREADSDADSEFTASKEQDEDPIKNEQGPDWDVVTRSSASTSPVRLRGNVVSRRYKNIAPQPSGPLSAARGSSISSENSNKIRKKRSPLLSTWRSDTKLTRQINACVRCRMQRNRVRDICLSLILNLASLDRR